MSDMNTYRFNLFPIPTLRNCIIAIPISLCSVPSTVDTSGSGDITPSFTNRWHWTMVRPLDLHSIVPRFLTAPSAQREIHPPQYPLPSDLLLLSTPSFTSSERQWSAVIPLLAPSSMTPLKSVLFPIITTTDCSVSSTSRIHIFRPFLSLCDGYKYGPLSVTLYIPQIPECLLFYTFLSVLFVETLSISSAPLQSLSAPFHPL